MSSTRTLSPDDLSPGTLLTVRLIRRQMGPDHVISFSFPDDELAEWEDDWTTPDFFHTWEHPSVGMPLVVTAVNLPFVAVLRAGTTTPGTLDIRTCKLQRITQAYCRAAMGQDAMDDLMRRAERLIGGLET